ncbi:MAG: tRNA (adenosine(37)-N6)-threonylcarbamoyltransferase complex dimerization subunit type 1 TsaB [Chitinivibrionia bacterium]|nr:tRNA (adenosine(37)-N6)-threonylcarbamoyltransferase complex dimerization subunit type 1 TsaB [Chitinivibrionia bacterium]
MITLGIDTSLDDVSFAIMENSTVLAEFNENLGRNLADKISEIFLELFKKAKVKIEDISRCGIVVGPGSFTGLRIGIAFAKGLFANSNVKIISVSSLECIARSCAKIGNISVVLDARQGEVFFAKFNNENEFVRLCDDKRISFEEAQKNENIIQAPNFAKNRGEFAAKIAAESEIFLTIDDIFPNYMQVSYAERSKI